MTHIGEKKNELLLSCPLLVHSGVIHTHTLIHTHRHTLIHTQRHTFIHTHRHTHSYIHRHTFIHTDTHTHTHTQTHKKKKTKKQTNKHTHKNKKQKEKRLCWAGEMAWLRNTGCSSRGPQLYSQQPHGGSQPKPNHL